MYTQLSPTSLLKMHFMPVGLYVPSVSHLCVPFMQLPTAGPRHLLDKLAALHLDPRIITWLHSDLMGRSQRVVVGGEQSTSLPVISGVPQGSVLGQLDPLYQ